MKVSAPVNPWIYSRTKLLQQNLNSNNICCLILMVLICTVHMWFLHMILNVFRCPYLLVINWFYQEARPLAAHAQWPQHEDTPHGCLCSHGRRRRKEQTEVWGYTVITIDFTLSKSLSYGCWSSTRTMTQWIRSTIDNCDVITSSGSWVRCQSLPQIDRRLWKGGASTGAWGLFIISCWGGGGPFREKCP